MFLHLFFYYLIVILSVGLFFTVGYAFHAILKTKPGFTQFDIFLNIVTGLILIIAIYSIVVTQGSTVSWLYLYILAGYAFLFKPGHKSDYSFRISLNKLIKTVAGLIGISLILYVVYLSSLLDFKSLSFTETNVDWQYYAKTSQYLNLGFESTSQFDNIAFGSSFTPYHYFEIWLSALFSKVFDIPSQIATSVIMPVVLACIAYIGILSFCQRLTLKNILTSFGLLFISSVTVFSSVLSKLGIAVPIEAGGISSVVGTFKLFPVLVFMLLAIHFLLKGNYLQSLLILLLIPVASFGTAPVIVAFVWLIILFFLYYYDRNTKHWHFLFFIAGYTLLLIAYYIVFWDSADSYPVVFSKEILPYVYSLITPVLLLIYSLPMLLFVIWRRDELKINIAHNKEIKISFVLLVLLSSGMAVFMSGDFNGVQFFTSIFVPLITSVVSVYALNAKFIRLSTRAYLVLFSILLLSSVYYSVKYVYRQRTTVSESSFVAGVLKAIDLDDPEEVRCGFINSREYYSFYLSAMGKVFMPGGFLDSYRNDFIQVSLSDFQALSCLSSDSLEKRSVSPTKKTWIPFDYEYQKSVKKHAGKLSITEGTFFKFYESLKQDGESISIDEAQLTFIDKFRLSYLLISNNAEIPSALLSRIQLIVSESNPNGYSFYRVVKESADLNRKKTEKN